MTQRESGGSGRPRNRAARGPWASAEEGPGPETKRGLPGSDVGMARDRLQPVRRRGGHESAEERVRMARPRLQLGMELHRDEPGVVGNLEHLDQTVLGADPGEDHPPLLQRGAVGVVELIAVPVALLDQLLPVGSEGAACGGDAALVGAEPHGPPLVV